jgi:Mg-chelatase subunit ChlD
LTNLAAGINLAVGELDNTHAHERPSIDDVIIIITDGNPNQPGGQVAGRAAASASADAARAAGIEVFVVGVGSDVDATYLKTDIADDDAHYFAAANFSDLQAVLETLLKCQP